MEEEDGDEIKSLIKVWITVFASLTYCYYIMKRIPKGLPRLISLLPIISLFTLLPFNLSSIHFGVVTSALVSWFSSSKLLLFAFDQGPLSSDPSMPLFQFISIACFPVKTEKETTPSTGGGGGGGGGLKSCLNYITKGMLLALIIKIYDYRPLIHPYLMSVIYSCHVYFIVEIMLAITAVPVRALFGFEMEAQFNQPHLSTSLQDFWGRRWNLMFSNILRPTVYLPVRSICEGIVGRKYATLVALVAAFVVSGLMHELIFFHVSRTAPTWQVFWYFVLHGVCTALEIVAKEAVGDRWRLHPVISWMLTTVFMFVTGFWLFLANVVRFGADVRAIAEYGLLVKFIKNVV